MLFKIFAWIFVGLLILGFVIVLIWIFYTVFNKKAFRRSTNAVCRTFGLHEVYDDDDDDDEKD